MARRFNFSGVNNSTTAEEDAISQQLESERRARDERTRIENARRMEEERINRVKREKEKEIEEKFRDIDKMLEYNFFTNREPEYKSNPFYYSIGSEEYNYFEKKQKDLSEQNIKREPIMSEVGWIYFWVFVSIAIMGFTQITQ